MEILSGLRVAAIIANGFEESELIEPLNALSRAGAKVDLISFRAGPVQAFRHHTPSTKVDATRSLHEASAVDYDCLLLPGGALSADALRMDPQVKTFAREIQSAGKPIAAICHAPWILISAGLVRGRTLAGFTTIQDDIRNAGGKWMDREVVVDSNWITSRKPSDIPAFNREMITVFSRRDTSIIAISESA